MKITYDILKNLLMHNKNIKLKFRDNSNTLDVFIYNQIIITLELDNNSIEKNCEVIYNSITQLEGITMYIPKIYIKEN